jgi:hypothetical protein
VLNFGLGLALPAISTRAVLGAGAHVGSAWALVGFSQQLVAALAVQFLGLVHSDSAWPVLCLSLGVVLLVALLDGSRMKGARNQG